MTDVQEAMVKLQKFSRSIRLLDLIRKGPRLDREYKNSFLVQRSTWSHGRKFLLMILVVINWNLTLKQMRISNFFHFSLTFFISVQQNKNNISSLDFSSIHLFTRLTEYLYWTYRLKFSRLLYQNSTGILLLSEPQNIKISS